jgi:hypothetical protein
MENEIEVYKGNELLLENANGFIRETKDLLLFILGVVLYNEEVERGTVAMRSKGGMDSEIPVVALCNTCQ